MEKLCNFNSLRTFLGIILVKNVDSVSIFRFHAN